MFPNMVRQQPSILCLVKPTRPDKARRLGYKVFSVLTCLYGIQSTRLKELENGMTKDVLLDLIKRGTRVIGDQGNKPELEEQTGKRY